MRIGILAAVAVFASREAAAQRAVAPAFARSHGAPAPTLRYPLSADAADSRAIVESQSPSQTHQFTALVAMRQPDPPRPPRGPIALRGLAVGAVVGAVVGYSFGRHEEYGGAVLGPIVGGIVGAPVGMIALLLLSP